MFQSLQLYINQALIATCTGTKTGQNNQKITICKQKCPLIINEL